MQLEDVETSVSLPPTKEDAAEKKASFKKPGRIDEVHSVAFTAIFGGALCLVSGLVNAVAFMGFGGGITHVTGTSTKIGWYLALGITTGGEVGNRECITMFLECVGKVACFFLGSMISGSYLGGSRTFKGGPRYSHLLFGVAAFMYASYGAAYGSNVYTGAVLLAVASGMQNAMTTLYSSAIVRTTHVTGTVTDMGVEIGKMLVQKDFSGAWKLKMHSTFLFSYIFGGFIGALLYEAIERAAILLPASIVLALAIVYTCSLSSMLPVKGSKHGYGLHGELIECAWLQSCYGKADEAGGSDEEEGKRSEMVKKMNA
jgi:uncharacterized membrane protein YoaK (UPF0700 family)